MSEQFHITYLLMGFTCLISIQAFGNHILKAKLKHWPYEEKRSGEYYRWLTSGFLHQDYMHLLFNMITLYFFGVIAEIGFANYFGSMGLLVFVGFYLVSILVPSFATFQRYKDSPSYAALGASGAVSAVLFSSILFYPTMPIRLLFIPFPTPGIIFGILYLWYSDYMAKRGGDNIDHFAHFIGAAFGFCAPILLKPELFLVFLAQVQAYFFS
jgi:membrane associated rhomboid family serine protease